MQIYSLNGIVKQGEKVREKEADILYIEIKLLIKLICLFILIIQKLWRQINVVF